MIFITTGSMFPFDRLMKLVDELAEEEIITQPIIAQIGEGSYLPQKMEWVRLMPKEEYDQRIAEADFVISHAGMGTISQALKLNTPLITLPRRPEHGEATSDHQLHTAQYFASRGSILSVESKEEMSQAIRSIDSFEPKPRNVNRNGIAQAIQSEIRLLSDF